MNFQIGDKVVCVDDEWEDNTTRFRCPKGTPIKGRIYVVSDVFMGYSETGKRDTLALCLVGIPCFDSFANGSDDDGWAAEMFRKLDEMKAESRELHYAAQTTPQP